MIFALSRTKVETSTPLWRVKLKPCNEILQTCLMCPCRAFHEWFFFIFYFFADNVGPLRHKYPPPRKKARISGGVKNETVDKGSAGAHSTRVQILRVSTLKNCVDIGIRSNSGFYLRLNQPVLTLRVHEYPSATDRGGTAATMVAWSVSIVCL